MQTLSYQGLVLEDAGQFPGDVFHIWHIKTTDLQGNVINSGQYGWGEVNNGEFWNPANNTETYDFMWGSVSTQFIRNGNNLDMVVTETNNAGSGIILDGVQIYPMALHFPQDPAGFYGYTQFAITTTGPGVSVADYGSGVVTSVIPNESLPLYGGWENEGTYTYAPSMTSTSPDGLAPFLPHNDLPVMPGNTLTYTVSLRFTPEGTQAAAADAYSSFAAQYPSQMTWKDKRIIGTAYLSSAPPSTGDASQPGGFPTNPRRYFNDPSVDITTQAGLGNFQSRMLAQAALNVTTAQAMNAQGVITWDIEGERYPQDTSYVCSPDQIAVVAPEMESTIMDQNSPYFGSKLDDAYFGTLSAAGLKVGLCLRPQVFTLYPDGTAGQNYLATNSAIVANLENKASYANARWGASIFYVDSNVDTYGGTLDPAVYQQLITDLPGFLFIPEENTPRYYAYTAPFYSFFANNSLGTPASTYNFYPKAFGANLINDVSAATLAEYEPQLTQSVVNGDILMGHADWFQPNDATLIAIYAAAGVNVPPVQTTPVISWSAPSSITYGTPLSAAQLDAVSNVAGTFTYTPAAGTILSAGTNALLVTFTPVDRTDYRSVTASVNLTVLPAAPTISWSAPASIPSGTALSSAQLNATASVPGTFVYSPPSGSVLTPGAHLLSVTFTPTDSVDYTAATASVTITITTPATSVITWANPASITYGTPLSATQLNATASVPGSFTYSPAAGAVLSAGTQTLSVTFTPSGTTSYKTTTASVTLVVLQATPVITWANPAPITSGTALSSTQLNATANVSGTLIYNPPSGSVLSPGAHLLSVTFTPTDSVDYTAATASVTITVNSPATPVITWANPASITYGTPLSATQLNATASVAGSFTYSPAAGAVLSAGTRTLSVTFTPSDTVDYKTTTASVTLVVLQAAPVITWANPAPITSGTALSSTQLNATANVPGTLVYNPPSGSVLSTGAHLLSVTFTPTDGVDYTAATASVTITVNSPATPVITWANPASITYGTPLSATQLNATASVPGSFTYSPAAGAVLSAGTQSLNVTFTPSDTVDYKTTTASVTLVVLQAAPAITWTNPAPIISGTALSSTQLNATANVPGTLVYNPPSGSVLSPGAHLLSVTFTPTDSVDYTATTASVTITVNSPATPVITWANPASITYGTPLSATQLNATASVPGSFTYSPAAGAVLSAGTQSLNVTFTPSDTVDYKTTTASVTLVVLQAAPVITWASPAPITSGTALSSTQLNATANVPGTLVYNPPSGSVLGAGAHLLSVTFTPTDGVDYTAATASVTITVNSPATPVITWANPASITYGTPLSAMQLNATASVPGSFTYSPAAGAVVSAGTRTLNVTFTPSDTTDYRSAAAAVTLIVLPATPAIVWSSPAAVIAGTPLSASQLNATASVPGSFTYNPAAGAVLSAGTYTLTVSFTPADGTDYTTAGASVPFTVIPPPPPANVSIVSPIAGSTISGVITVTGQINLANIHLDSAGTFLMVDGIEIGTGRIINPPYLYPLDTTTLANGPHVLQLWAHDIGNNTTISAAVPVTVQN